MQSSLKLIRKYSINAGIVWTVCIVLIWAWNYYSLKDETRHIILNEAKAYFNKDQAFRFWAASHGGVYVPPTEVTPPNPYLSHIPDRDVVTTEGKKLTLMNPAWMLRQIIESYTELYGVKGHITSLKPLRPSNKPDDWEKEALMSFENGVSEVSMYSEIDGKTFFRFMKPMFVKKGCMKCHAHQGYKVGDIRGGVSVSVPMEQILSIEKKNILNMTLAHIFILLIGYAGIGLSHDRVSRSFREKEEAQIEINMWTEAFKNAQWGVVVGDADSDKLKLMNSAFAKMHGYSVEELTGESVLKIYAPEERDNYKHHRALAHEKGHYTFEAMHIKKDGTIFPVYNDATTIKDKSGEIKYRVVNVQDITDRKKTEIKISRSLKEKEVLLQEIHHRVKNNLAVISSLLALQAKHIDDEKYLEMFKDSQSRIRSMALVHEKLYQGEDFSHINVKEYFNSLLDTLKNTYSVNTNIKTKIEIDNILLGPDILIPCGLIVNELVTNSFKHGIKDTEEPEVKVSIKKIEGNKLLLSISDNGAGLPEDFDLNSSTGLGLKLLEPLTKQINGELEIINDPGATFNIIFQDKPDN